MLVIISSSATLLKTLSHTLHYTIYRELSHDLLRYINVTVPLPYVVALSPQDFHKDNIHTKKSIFFKIPTAYTETSSYMQQELSMLCGILYTFPIQIQCILYIDIIQKKIFEEQKKYLKPSLSQQNTNIHYFFAHSIYSDIHSPCLYTDILLPNIANSAVIHSPLYSFSTLIQRYWSSHCIQSFHIIDHDNTEHDLSISQLQKQLPIILECIQSLQSLDTEFRFPQNIQQQLQTLKTDFGFTQTQMAKLHTLIKGILQAKTSIPNIVTLTHNIENTIASKNTTQNTNNLYTLSVSIRNILFTQLCEQLLEPTL